MLQGRLWTLEVLFFLPFPPVGLLGKASKKADRKESREVGSRQKELI